MSEFHELIKSFAKSREYVRDFFVYGFKTRDEFGGWSGRTYDNERRRLESWLSGYVRQEYTGSGTALAGMILPSFPAFSRKTTTARSTRYTAAATLT